MRAVLLDIDGTLVDSNAAHAQAWTRALNAHARRVSLREIRPLIGMGADKLLPLVGVDHKSKEGQQIQALRSALFASLVPHLRPTRGARRLVECLRGEGLAVVIATSAKSSEVEALLQVAEVSDLIDAAADSDDADRSKPDPDIVRAALQHARVTARDAVMIGDTPYDMEAAGRSGVRPIALRCGGWWSDQDLSGAIAIYDDPEDLVAHFSTSPLHRSFEPPLPGVLRNRAS